jgi:hypothetical protein
MILNNQNRINRTNLEAFKIIYFLGSLFAHAIDGTCFSFRLDPRGMVDDSPDR